MPSDEELAKSMKQAILRDERLSFQPIDLSVDEGLVTLSGSVQTYRRKLAAHEAVSSFEGCRDVINNLTVEPLDPPTDEEIANNVRAALNSHADVTKQTITVSVTRGIVKLSGNVGDQWERVVVKDVALSVRGVRDVQNLLTVDLLEQMADWKLEQNIEEAFFHTRGLKNTKINVAVTGGAVVLSGEVPKLSQKEMAEKVVQRFRFMHVHNEIVVTGR